VKFISKLTVGVFLLYLTVVLFVAAVILAVLATVGPAKAMGDQPPPERTTTGRQAVTQNNMERVSVEMELISGSMICATYHLPIERGHFYTDTRKSAYGTFYKVDNRPRLLRYAVIYAREVEQCDFAHKGVYNQ